MNRERDRQYDDDRYEDSSYRSRGRGYDERRDDGYDYYGEERYERRYGDDSGDDDRNYRGNSRMDNYWINHNEDGHERYYRSSHGYNNDRENYGGHGRNVTGRANYDDHRNGAYDDNRYARNYGRGLPHEGDGWNVGNYGNRYDGDRGSRYNDDGGSRYDNERDFRYNNGNRRRNSQENDVW